MGTGKVAKKSGSKAKKAGDADKAILKEQLDNTGPFILRDFCRQHGMDPDDAKLAKKSGMVSFLMGKFKSGDLTLTDLYPDRDEDEPKAKKAKKSEPRDDDHLEDNAGGDDIDNDELDDELEGELEDDELEVDLEDDELEAESEDGDELAGEAPDISLIEDKLDKIIDQNSRMAKRLDLVSQALLETLETLRQGMLVLFKIGKVKDPRKLLKQIKNKVGQSVGKKSGRDDELEDE